MNSSSQSAGKPRLTVREMCLLALFGALMFGTQVAMASLPNIHMVAMFIILAVILFSWKAMYSVAVFVLLEGMVYGFGIWWMSYLYIWPLLVVIAVPFRANDSALFWAVIAGIHGLLFGALCAIPYLFIGGWAAAVSYWIAGIPFDLMQCAGNFVLTLLLLMPLKKLSLKLL